jgi:2-keto-4-pentenoate hydratase
MRRLKNRAPRIERAGEWLYLAHQRREPFAPLPEDLAPRDIAEAYAIQGEYVGMRGRDLGAVAGYKIALTTPQMRRMVGMSEPIAGDILEKTVLHGPARVRAANYVRLLVEFEIALELGDDLPAVGAPFTRESVAAAVKAVMPALELADDRNADYALLPSHPLMLIADNAWNEGVVLGEPVQDWRRIDLAEVRGVALVNDSPVGEGRGRDVMGHPLEALAWIANHLAARGLGLWRSDIVITGSLVATRFAKPGERIRFEAGPLGSVALVIE